MFREMKEKVRKEYLRRVKLVAKSHLYGRNLISANKCLGDQFGEIYGNDFGLDGKVIKGDGREDKKEFDNAWGVSDEK